MSKQTAVEFYRTELSALVSMKESKFQTENEIFDQAKQMEKEQMIDAYTECWMNDGGNGFHKVKEAESYYNETYGGQDETL
jgi:HEPN domain-containing protein